MNKYIERALIDIQYFVNNKMLNHSNSSDEKNQISNREKSDMKQFNQDIQLNLNNFISDAQQYIDFYNQNIKSILENI